MRMAAYCRVSTEKEEQLSSLENQREFFEQYADKEGDTLVKIYADVKRLLNFWKIPKLEHLTMLR